MHIDRMQDEVRELMQGIEHPRVGAALALAEECGEVMRCVLEIEYYGQERRDALREEAGDLLVALSELCDRYDVSLERCAGQAIEKLRRKAPAWRESLGEHLRSLRERMDG